ncbi:hypothetical protein OG21DRAFT_959572 [Imleria badia]|nr:hypothetical protein OG21DRAFT_959572 [Imleria badia]
MHAIPAHVAAVRLRREYLFPVLLHFLLHPLQIHLSPPCPCSTAHIPSPLLPMVLGNAHRPRCVVPVLNSKPVLFVHHPTPLSPISIFRRTPLFKSYRRVLLAFLAPNRSFNNPLGTTMPLKPHHLFQMSDVIYGSRWMSIRFHTCVHSRKHSPRWSIVCPRHINCGQGRLDSSEPSPRPLVGWTTRLARLPGQCHTILYVMQNSQGACDPYASHFSGCCELDGAMNAGFVQPGYRNPLAFREPFGRGRG